MILERRLPAVLAAAALLAAGLPAHVAAQSAEIRHAEIDSRAAAVSGDVIAWRRDFHQNPELGNREFRTAGVVAEHHSPYFYVNEDALDIGVRAMATLAVDYLEQGAERR